MPSPEAGPQFALEVVRTIAAPPEQVFDAWTKPEHMKKWFCRPMGAPEVQIRVVELRAGGRLEVEVTDPSGKIWKLFSQYREVVRPERLSFTWKWDGHPEWPESMVNIEFKRLGNSNFTEVKLSHVGISSAQEHKGTQEGWKGCFIQLEQEMAKA
jgi:uncharacterized protein YndB with AHSA1/START domain